MKFPWRYLVVIGGLMLAGALIVGCEEEVMEAFPDMASPTGDKGGIRGHMHGGGATEAVLCSEEWETQELGDGLVMVNCPGAEFTASIDSSQNDLFFFDGLEPGDYWLMARADSGRDIPAWYMIGERGHKVTVKEGQWTDLATFESE